MSKGGTTGRACIALVLCLGAGPPAPAADCNLNGVEDRLEITSGSQADCNGNGIPDSCDILPINYGLAARGSLNTSFPPLAAEAADLDGDGAIDLAASSRASPVVGILWNGGRGSFSEPELFSIEGLGLGIAAADLDGDLRVDLVITTPTGISFFLNRGSRRFTAAALEINAANLPMRAPVLADLDGDGDADLAGLGSFRVLILENQGDGAFTVPPTVIPVGSNPVALAAVRLDGDADIDLLTANRLESQEVAGNVSVLLNQGGGTFEPPRNFGVGKDPTSIAAGDVDGDGDMDAVAACFGSGVLGVLLGAGDGSFSRGEDVLLEGSPGFAALHDVDQDADLDLPFSRFGFRQLGFVGVRLNQGDGTFASPVEFPSLMLSDRLLITDVTGDGSPEFVAVIPGIALWSFLVLESVAIAHDTDCDGTGVPDGCELVGNDCNRNRFLDTCEIASGTSSDCDRNRVPDECDPDCNANGTPDVCDLAAGTSDCNANGLPDECDIGPAAPRFKPRWVELAGEPVHQMDSADLDADGRLDIFGVRTTFPSVTVLWGEGHGELRPPVDFGLGDAGGIIAAIDEGDLDADGDLDLVAIQEGSQNRIMVLSQEARSFAVTASLADAVFPNAVALGDVEGDGDVDIAVLDAVIDTALLFANDGSGSFNLLPERSVPLSPGPLLFADVDGDGRVDLAGRDLDSGFLRVFWNEGVRFQAADDIRGRASPNSVTRADLDGDGDLDLVGGIFDGFTIAFQEAPRQFRTAEIVLGFSGGFGFRANDLDRDGDMDLALPGFLSTGTQKLVVLRNAGGGAFDEPIVLSVGGVLGALTSGDYDGDGAADLAAPGELLCSQDCGPFFVTLFNETQYAGSADADLNGRPDECDPGAFRRGDSGGDGVVDLADPVFTLRALFQGGPAPACAEAADADNDGRVDLADAVLILDFLFRGGPPPATPGPVTCGLDPDPAGGPRDLGCASHGSC